MATRTRAIDVGSSKGRSSLARLTADIRAARTSSGLAQTDVARAMGLSRSQYGRIERGQSPLLSLLTASRLCAILGLDLSVRAYPAGDPIRDAAQIALLVRLRSRCHPSLAWRTEVPFPLQGRSPRLGCDRRDRGLERGYRSRDRPHGRPGTRSTTGPEGTRWRDGSSPSRRARLSPQPARAPVKWRVPGTALPGRWSNGIGRAGRRIGPGWERLDPTLTGSRGAPDPNR